MEALMPSDLQSLFSTKSKNKSVSKKIVKKSLSQQNNKKQQRTYQAKKNQANKHEPVEIAELLWLKKHFSLKVIFTILLLLSVMVAPFYLSDSDIMPINKIRIKGAFKQLESEPIKSRLKGYLGQGFFSVDIQSMQQKISQMAWVQSVSVHRIWPSQLVVDIIEKKPFARWDAKHLLSRNAKVFEAQGDAFKALPLINGLKTESASLLQRYQRLQPRFSAIGLTLDEMREDGKGALFLTLNNEILVKLGSQQTAAKIDHLLAVYNTVIKPQVAYINTIDFRYSNGFAIAWKPKKLKQQKLKQQKLKQQKLKQQDAHQKWGRNNG